MPADIYYIYRKIIQEKKEMKDKCIYTVQGLKRDVFRLYPGDEVLIPEGLMENSQSFPATVIKIKPHLVIFETRAKTRFTLTNFDCSKVQILKSNRKSLYGTDAIMEDMENAMEEERKRGVMEKKEG